MKPLKLRPGRPGEPPLEAHCRCQLVPVGQTTVRRRSALERAVAQIRRLNEPPEPPKQRRRSRAYMFPEPGSVAQLFREAAKIR